jgi:hypothetical protein
MNNNADDLNNNSSTVNTTNTQNNSSYELQYTGRLSPIMNPVKREKLLYYSYRRWPGRKNQCDFSKSPCWQ